MIRLKINNKQPCEHPNCRAFKIMKNAEMNKTKGVSIDETALVLVKKIKWVGNNLPAGIPWQL